MLKCSQHNWERHSNFRAGDACSWGGQETSCWGSPWAALGPRHSVSERIEVSPGHQNGDRKEKKELPPTAIQRGAPLQYLHRIWTFVFPISCESLQPTLKDTFLKVLIFAPFSVPLYSEQSTRGKSSAEIESNPSGRPRQEKVSAWGHHGKVPQGHGTHRLQGQTSQETKVNSFELQSYEANNLLFIFVSGRRSNVPVQCGFSFIGH